MWAGKSLKERCVLFHRHFGNHRINSTLLRKFYLHYRIKRKSVKFTKHIEAARENEYEQWRLDIKAQIAQLKKDGHRIIYIDETLFTTKTIQSKDYTCAYHPHRIP